MGDVLLQKRRGGVRGRRLKPLMPPVRQRGGKLRGEFLLLICCRCSKSNLVAQLQIVSLGTAAALSRWSPVALIRWFRREVVEGFCYHKIKVVLPAVVRAELTMRLPSAQTGGSSRSVRGGLSWRPEPRS